MQFEPGWLKHDSAAGQPELIGWLPNSHEAPATARNFYRWLLQPARHRACLGKSTASF
jgi:hypothetical protein